MIIQWNLVIALIVCLQGINEVLGRHDGAPFSACKTGRPGHRKTTPQEGTSPYTVKAVDYGAYINVTIEDDVDHTTFRGFLLQAFFADNNEMIPNGVFIPPDHAKGLKCTPDIDNSLTHNSKIEKKMLTAIWIPPNGMQRDVYFKATIVKKYDEYWMGASSNSIRVKTTGEPPKYTRPTTDAQQSSTPGIDVSSDVYSGCGIRKGCFGFPNNCVQKSSCEMVLSYTKLSNESAIYFELVGSLGTKTEGYFAVGLSRDSKMGDDSVTECVLYKGQVLIYESWNYKTLTGRNNRRLDGPLNITSVSLDYTNGVVSCRWIRPMFSVVNKIVFDVEERNFFLLLAKGELDKDGNKKFHHDNTEVSSTSVNLLVTQLIKGKPPTLVKLHGSLMTVAWIGFVSIAILIARHYKVVWPKYEFLGTKVWFTIHRGFMILSVLCASVGFILIFVEAEGWSAVGLNPHPILGVIVTVLMILQPFIAALRPSPSSPKRPIFRWIHGLIGNGAQILACVNMFFAVSLTKSNLPTAFYWVLSTFIIFHCLTHLLIHFHTYLMEMEREREGRKMKQKSTNFQPGDGYSTNEAAPGSAFKKFVLGLYSLVVVGLTAALVLMICLN